MPRKKPTHKLIEELAQHATALAEQKYVKDNVYIEIDKRSVNQALIVRIVHKPKTITTKKFERVSQKVFEG